MPTAVLDVDADALPAGLTLAARYGRALILVRWRGIPVGQIALPVRDGVVRAERLREAVREATGATVARRALHRLLAGDDGAAASPPPATVAVCTRDRPDDLARCLAALARLPDDGQEILVVDSASAGDATRDVVDRHAALPGLRYVREDRPGLDVARNRALREARHEIVAFTDDDATPDPGWLRALTRGFGDPRTLCVTGLTLPLELETEAQEAFERTNGFGRGFDRVTYDGTRQNPFLVGRIGAGVNMALRRSVLAHVGAFDEALDAGTPTHSGGDHDMFVRILTAGYTIVYEPAALSRHRHRREWDALRRTVHGYGVGVYAVLTRHLLAGELAPLGIAVGWARAQGRELVRSLVRWPGSTPLDLVLAELRGCAAGPGAYVASRRAARRAAPHTADPTPS
jgi:glycosyltransferase involved in cell wall biosynthesis